MSRRFAIDSYRRAYASWSRARHPASNPAGNINVSAEAKCEVKIDAACTAQCTRELQAACEGTTLSCRRRVHGQAPM